MYVYFVQSPIHNFTRSYKPSLGPIQPAKPLFSTSICLTYDPYYIQEPRDGPKCYPEPGTLINEHRHGHDSTMVSGSSCPMAQLDAQSSYFSEAQS